MGVALPLLIFLAIGMVAVTLAVRTAAPDERGWLQKTLTIALIVRVGLAVFFELYKEFRVFHEDARGYELLSVRLALIWQAKMPPIELHPLNAGFFYIGGAICYVFGPYPLNVPLFNAVVGTMTVFLIYRLARRYFHLVVARGAALLVAFTPSMILWSSIALKDAFVTMMIVISLSSCLELQRRVTLAAVLGTVVPLAVIQTTRFYMVYFVAFSVVVALFFDRSTRVLSGLWKQVFLAGAAVTLFLLVGLSGKTIQGTEYLSLEQVSRFRTGMAITAKSGFEREADISTPGRALSFLPLGAANLLFAPFPWQWTSLGSQAAAPETIAWWLLFPATLRGLIFAFRRRFAAISPVLIFTVTLTCAYSLMQGNVGSAFRQRAQIFVFLFIFSALGWYQRKCRRAGLDEELLLHGQEDAAPEPASQPMGSPPGTNPDVVTSSQA